MTLQEAENLRQQNLAHTLRMPKCLLSASEDDMAVRNNIRYGICYLIKKLDMEDPTQSKNLLIRNCGKILNHSIDEVFEYLLQATFFHRVQV